MTPTQRTLTELRKQGYECGIVERYISFRKIRIDLFGCIDLIAIKKGETLGIQATSDSNRSSHFKKICAEPRALKWLEAGNKLELWTWGKHGAKGKRKLWTLHITPITYEDLPKLSS